MIRTDDLPATVAEAARERAPEVTEVLDGADRWAISEPVAQLLAALIRRLSPRSVLEFGAGRSSLVLGRSLQMAGGGRLTSLDHEPAFASGSWARIGDFDRVDAQLVTAPLRLRLSRQGLLYGYGFPAAALAKRGPFDFILVDGPPSFYGRDGTLLTVSHMAAPGAVVVLDDAGRPGERTAVRRWRRALDCEIVAELPDFGRGVTVLRLGRPGKPRFAMRTFLGTFHDRITRHPQGRHPELS